MSESNVWVILNSPARYVMEPDAEAALPDWERVLLASACPLCNWTDAHDPRCKEVSPS